MNKDGTNMSYGICSPEEAKQIGKKLFQQYGGKVNDPNSTLSSEAVCKIFADVYNIIDAPFTAGPGDVEGMNKVLDTNSDGLITCVDFQTLCVKILAFEAQEVSSPSKVQQSQVYQQQPQQQVYQQQVVQQTVQMTQPTQAETNYLKSPTRF